MLLATASHSIYLIPFFIHMENKNIIIEKYLKLQKRFVNLLKVNAYTKKGTSFEFPLGNIVMILLNINKIKGNGTRVCYIILESMIL